LYCFFFFQAEDGIRDLIVTGVQTCALPIWFVGTMEGVILSIAPRAMVVGITHEIPPGDIRGGAMALAASCRFFPKGTVHVAVVRSEERRVGKECRSGGWR